jgi:hypothetical protein
MLDSQIIQAAISDPIVIRARSLTKADGTVVNPTPAELSAAATTELVAEIQYLRSVEDINRALTEKEYSLTLTVGGTNVEQGTWYTLPDEIGSILGATIGDSRRPVDVMTNREEFNRWWYFHHGEQDLTDDAQVVIQWDPTTQGEKTILLSPGRGSDSTLYILNRRDATSFTSAMFDAEDHHVILQGLKNRMSGGAFEVGYERSLMMLRRRIAPILHRPTAMRRPERVERLAWALRNEYGDVQDYPRIYR